MKISEHVRTTITQDGAVLMNIKAGWMLTLNATGSIIWRQLTDGRTPSQIAAQLSSEFGIPLAGASADVNEFLGQLEAQHLIESAEFQDSRKPLGPKPGGLFRNLFARRNSESGQRRGSR